MIKFNAPAIYNFKIKELKLFIKKNNPFLTLKKFTGNSFQGNIIIKHKDTGQGAEFKEPNKIFINLGQPIEYCWLSICHESAHLILRKIKWSNNIEIRKVINKHKNYKSKKIKYNFQYAIEQTLAFLLQAACEAEAKIRPLKWSAWRDTFEANDVLLFGEIWWKQWQKYVKNKKHASIKKWVAKNIDLVDFD